MNDRWNNRYLGLAEYISSFSKDPSTKVGAVIARPDKTVASIGYNGLPRGVDDLDERLNNREIKYAFIVHAEKNAILHARERLEGYTLYTWPFMPCADCAGTVIQSGIKHVIAPESNIDRWQRSFDFTQRMFSEAGVSLTLYGTEGSLQ